MPVKVTAIGHGKYRVSTPHGVRAKSTTKKKAESQRRLLNAVEHNPNFHPRSQRVVHHSPAALEIDHSKQYYTEIVKLPNSNDNI